MFAQISDGITVTMLAWVPVCATEYLQSEFYES